jgi:subtilase family serine protease
MKHSRLQVAPRARVARPKAVGLMLALAAVSAAQHAKPVPVQMAPVPSSFRGTAKMGDNIGAVPDAQPIHVSISLQLKDEAGLQKFIDDVSDPNSPNFHQFISPEEVGQRFGADQADVDATVAFLTSNGLTVDTVAKNRMVVFAHGPAAQVQAAFRTQLAQIRRSEDGSVFHTNLSAAQVPAALAPKILTINGLDNSIRGQRRSSTTFLNPTLFRACYQDKNAYSLGFTGKGVNIAIANWDGFKLNNVPLYCAKWGLPVPTTGAGSNIHVKLVGGNPYPDNATRPQGEGDLDIQMVLMASPLADIYVYDDTMTTNSPTAGVDDNAPLSTLAAISNDNLADIVTESYGWMTYGYDGPSRTGTYYGAFWTTVHHMHMSMTAQGMTYLAASGDDGTNEFVHVTGGANSSQSYAYPSIDPDVLVVGGSVATVDSTTGARQGETSWGLVKGAGGTGGFDFYDTPARGFGFNVAPTYQTSTIFKFTNANNFRLLPDVAGHSSGQDGLPTTAPNWAYAIYYNQGNTTWPLGRQLSLSGTSCASPAYAGAFGALAQRIFGARTPSKTRGNVRLGRLQDVIYHLSAHSGYFYDIGTGTSVGVIPGTTINATPAPGWDFATGLGALNFDALYNILRAHR